MTRPDLDALQALLDKNPHDGTDAAQALLALPALIARVRELESYCAGYKKMIDAVTDPAVDKAAALAMRERCAEICSKAARERTSDPTSWATAADCAAAIRALGA